jgi:6-pyruvoyltetrahydropterin/6-carboxytetrahydropterin synthase
VTAGEFKTGISITFHASHSLKGNFGPACDVHPHDYRLDVTVRGSSLTDEGILIDIVQLEGAVRGLVDRWDGKCLDELTELQDINTTVEALARFVHERVSRELSDYAEFTLEAKVWESPTVWGAYQAPIPAKS